MPTLVQVTRGRPTPLTESDHPCCGLCSGAFKRAPGVDVIPYEELKGLRLEDGVDVSRKVRRALVWAWRGSAGTQQAAAAGAAAVARTPVFVFSRAVSSWAKPCCVVGMRAVGALGVE